MPNSLKASQKVTVDRTTHKHTHVRVDTRVRAHTQLLDVDGRHVDLPSRFHPTRRTLTLPLALPPRLVLCSGLLDGRGMDRPIDFLIGPYSSALSEACSKVANKRGALLMAPGGATTSIFKGRPLSFGMFNPSQT